MYTYIFIILPYKQFTVQRLFNLFLKEVSYAQQGCVYLSLKISV